MTGWVMTEGSVQMSALTALRRGRLAGAVIPALALGIAGIVVAQAGAQAAPRTPALHAGPKIALGTTNNITQNAFAQAPNGAVYYSRGAVVHVVSGNSAPRTVLHAAGKVLAIAASASDLFVQNGLTVTEYRKSNVSKVRHWTLPRQPAPVTMAGLFAQGGTLWSWVDTETDSSGLEFATVSRIATSRSAVHVITKFAFADAMDANSSGLYFESTNRGQSQYFLAHASPSGTVRYRGQPAVRSGPLPLAVTGGRIDVLTFAGTGGVNSYNSKTLALVSSKRVAAEDISLAATGVGLVVLGLVCHGQKCSKPTVSKLDAATGSTSGAVTVAGGFELVAGPSAVVIEISHGLRGTMTLQRIS
jgi:hypothetical protein